jgi:transcriptional regulator with XRE-family HTH domain
VTAQDVIDARAKLGMTQIEFGRCIGLATQSAVWRLEDGRRKVTRTVEININNLLALHGAGPVQNEQEQKNEKH